MNWFLIALVAPFLWAITNYIDKYLVSRYVKDGGAGALMIFSSLIGVFVFPLIAIFYPGVINIELPYAALLMLSGGIYVIAILPYYYALREDNTSVVVPLFQTIPVISYILAFFFLGETLSLKQILASLLIIFGAIIISLDLSEGKNKFKHKVFWLILLSSFFYSLNVFLFKFIAIKSDFWTTSFWEYVGFAMTALIFLFFVKSYRNQFFKILKKNASFVLSINFINEFLNIIGKMILNFVSLLIPLALTWVINGFQPVFVLIIGILLAIIFPKITNESLCKRHILQKVFAIFIMFIGACLLSL